MDNQAHGGAGEAAPPARCGALEVFFVALGLGMTSFGGPIAHLGYFERTYVQRRRWLTADDYAGLVALCQMTPGPASSQVGFLVGLRRAGWTGAFAAWIGFTLPSALLMFAFACSAPRLAGPLATAALHGLKLVAVAVVAQAVWSMGRKLCPDLQRKALAIGAAALLLFVGGASMQIAVLLASGVGGVLFCRGVRDAVSLPNLPIGRRTGLLAGTAFLTLLLGLRLAAQAAAPKSILALEATVYRAGALVFGGGHVVLPLLRSALAPSGWVSDGVFLAGYGAAQAVPGPLFAFGAYLGVAAAPPDAGFGESALWSAAALVFLFLPGLLVVVAAYPLWSWIGDRPSARGALAGVNAAVVGVLAAALYNPVWTSAILGARDGVIVLIALLLLERWRAPPILAVVFCIGAAVGSALVLP